MKKLFIWVISLFLPRRDKSPVLQDLLDNDHHYCKVCGDLYYSLNPKQLYCSKVCRVHFNNAKRSKR